MSFFFFCKIVYGPKNGLGFLELKLLYVFFVKNLRGSVIKSHLVYVLNNIIYIFLIFMGFFFTTIGWIFQKSFGGGGYPPISAPAWPMLDWIASNFDFLSKLRIFFSTIIMGGGGFWVSRLFHLFSFSYILIIAKLYTTFIAILHLLADDDFKICYIIIKKNVIFDFEMEWITIN